MDEEGPEVVTMESGLNHFNRVEELLLEGLA